MFSNSSSERTSFSDNIHVLVSDSNVIFLFRPYRRLCEEVLAQNVSYVQLLGNLELANMAFCLIHGVFWGKIWKTKTSHNNRLYAWRDANKDPLVHPTTSSSLCLYSDIWFEINHGADMHIQCVVEVIVMYMCKSKTSFRDHLCHYCNTSACQEWDWCSDSLTVPFRSAKLSICFSFLLFQCFSYFPTIQEM